MENNDLDKILEAKDMIRGLIDLICIISREGQKDKLIPVTILCPLEELLEKINTLLQEIVENERNI